MTLGRGRPSYSITQQQLEYFIENNFTFPEIARLLKVSVSTVRRRMSQFQLYIGDTFTSIDDDSLSAHIADIKVCNPNSGYRAVCTKLRLRVIKVPIYRIRRLCFEIDPAGAMSRWMMTIDRRAYSVPGPNSLWHIDGNHKLIRSSITAWISMCDVQIYILYS